MVKYYVIHNTDGDTLIDAFSREEFLQWMNEEFVDCEKPEFLDDFREPDTNCWGDGYLVIKGDIVVPKPVKIVEEFDVD